MVPLFIVRSDSTPALIGAKWSRSHHHVPVLCLVYVYTIDMYMYVCDLYLWLLFVGVDTGWGWGEAYRKGIAPCIETQLRY